MINDYISGIRGRELEMHAEPIAALTARKLASLALPSTHRCSYGHVIDLQSRAAPELDGTQRSRCP